MLERCVETALRHARIDDVVVVDRMHPTATARNHGIASVREDAIIFSVDDDCWWDDELRFDDALELATRPHCGIVQVTRLMPGKRPLPLARRRHHRVALTWMGAGMLFRRAVWAAVGGYPVDYLDDVMFGAVVYGAGWQNFRSNVSYGHHDVDTPRGGMQGVLAELGKTGFAPCIPERYLVHGDPCISKCMIPNIKNIKPMPALRRQHRKNRRCRSHD